MNYDWISVKYRLPEKEGRYRIKWFLLMNNYKFDKGEDVAVFRKGTKEKAPHFVFGAYSSFITHWKPEATQCH